MNVMVVFIGMLLVCLKVHAAQGDFPWEWINPGGGGQVQEVRLDPTVPNRLYLCSDMEGGYRSHDGGLSWEFITGGVSNGMQLMLAAEPGDTGRLYSGSMAGLDISDDHGKTWRLVPEMAGVSVATIAINPDNVSEVYVGHSWRAKGGRFGQESEQSGRREVWISKDRGQTWEAVQYEATEGLRQIETICIDPIDRQTVYLGANAGVYMSKDGGRRWNKLRESSSASAGRMRGLRGGVGEGAVAFGIALSPDGKVLYVRDEPSKVYCARVGQWNWMDVSAGLSPSRSSCGVAVEVDPQANDQQHRILVGGARRPDGLWEAEIDWASDGQLAGVTWRQVLIGASGGGSKSTIVEEGWLEGQGVFSRSFGYAPLSWQMGRKIWAVGGQTVFYADADSPQYPNNWYERYSRPVVNENGSKTFTTRGFHSTYNRDVVQVGKYLYATCADNGGYESYDGGASWTWARIRLAGQGSLASDCWSAEVARFESPVVVASMGAGFGGTDGGGGIYAKKLTTFSPKDQWVQIGGGRNSLNGLPDSTYLKIKIHPQHPDRVFALCRAGLYIIESLTRMLDGQTTTILRVNQDISSFDLDPVDPRVIYVSSGGGGRGQRGGGDAPDPPGTFRGELREGSWTWTRLGDPQIEVAASRLDGRRLLVASNGDAIRLNIGEEATWHEVFNTTQAEALRSVPWHRQGERLSMGAISAVGRWIFVSVWSDNKKGYGIFAGEIQLDGSVRWHDFTDNFFYPRSFLSKVIRDENRFYLYVATMGTGLWRRDITRLIGK